MGILERSKMPVLEQWWRLITHIEVTSDYGINKGKNLWVDPYYLREFARIERVLFGRGK